MATITIRNLDDDVVARWKERARRHHRSLESEVRNYLSEGVATFSRADLLKWADEIADRTPDGLQSDSTALIREDRDR